MYGIVGAGLSGLTVAHHLRERGEEVVVWEAEAEPGGVVTTGHVDGEVLERGPQRVRLTPGVRDLAEVAGVADDIVTAADPPLYGYRDGTLARMPLTLRDAVTTDLLSWRGKARILAEPFTAGVREDETVGEYLRRKFGDEAATHCFGPLYGGLYASDPDEMPVEHSLAKALDHAGVGRSVLLSAARKLVGGGERPPMAAIEGGLQRLPEGLAETLDVRLSTPVTGIEPVSDDRWTVETPDGRTDVEDLVLTVPSRIAGALLAEEAPDDAVRLRQLTYNPLVVVHLRSDWEFDGAGVKVPAVEGLATRGLTAHGPLFGRDGVVTAFLGGSYAPGLVGRDDEDLASLATREFETVTGASAEVLDVWRVEPGMPAYDETWDPLADLDLPDGIHLCANYVGRAGIPGRIRRALALAERLAGGDDAERVTPTPA